MKRRFRWWLSAVVLYLLSVPIIFISIGLTLYLIVVVYISVLGLTGPDAAGFPYMVILILFFWGIPVSLFSSFFIPPMLLGWIRKSRLRRLRRVRSEWSATLDSRGST